MATDAAKHVVPAGSDAARRQTLLDLILSAHDVIPVANATERATVLAAMVAAGRNPATSPVYVDQLDVGVVLRNVTTSDANWATISWPRTRGEWRLAANQSIPSGAFTQLGAATLAGTADAGLSNTAGSITVATAGIYRVTVDARWASSADTFRFGAFVTQNGSSIDTSGNVAAGGVLVGREMEIPASAQGIAPTVTTKPFPVAAADVLRAFVFQSTGAAVNVEQGTTSTYLGVTAIVVERVG